MQLLVLIVHVMAALAICVLVLLQHGKGADMGAAFGSGSSGSLFGASGSANFLSRATAVLATLFFVTSLGLTWFSAHQTEATGVVLEKGGPAPSTLPGSISPKVDGEESKTKEIPK